MTNRPGEEDDSKWEGLELSAPPSAPAATAPRSSIISTGFADDGAYSLVALIGDLTSRGLITTDLDKIDAEGFGDPEATFVSTTAEAQIEATSGLESADGSDDEEEPTGGISLSDIPAVAPEMPAPSAIDKGAEFQEKIDRQLADKAFKEKRRDLAQKKLAACWFYEISLKAELRAEIARLESEISDIDATLPALETARDAARNSKVEAAEEEQLATPLPAIAAPKPKETYSGPLGIFRNRYGQAAAAIALAGVIGGVASQWNAMQSRMNSSGSDAPVQAASPLEADDSQTIYTTGGEIWNHPGSSETVEEEAKPTVWENLLEDASSDTDKDGEVSDLEASTANNEWLVSHVDDLKSIDSTGSQFNQLELDEGFWDGSEGKPGFSEKLHDWGFDKYFASLGVDIDIDAFNNTAELVDALENIQLDGVDGVRLANLVAANAVAYANPGAAVDLM